MVHAESSSIRPVLTFEDCLAMGLAGSRTLELQRLHMASASADVQRVSSVYDTQLQLQGAWDDSEIPPGSFPSQGGYERGQATGRIYRELASGTQVGLEMDVQRNFFDGVGVGPAAEPMWRSAAAINLRQSLWRNSFGAANRAQVEYVRERLESLRLDYERSKEQVAARIADDYWSALIARLVANAQTSVVGRLRFLYDDQRAKVEEGLLDEIVVLAVDASLAVAEVDAEALQNEAEGLDERLKELIDLPARAWDATVIEYHLPPHVTDGPDPAFHEVYEDALRYRADLEALRREEKRVERLIYLAQMEDRSDLEVYGSVGRGDSDTELGDTFGFDQTLWSAGLVWQGSLERSASRADVTEALLQRERIRTEREILERLIELESRTAIRQVGTSRRLVAATRRALKAEEKKLDLALQRYNRGQLDIKTLLDYENDRELAERDYLRSLGALQRSQLALELAQGIYLRGAPP
jgi:outer membrane protein TolC